MRTRLILYGNVQGVGFRAIVKQLATQLKIKGQVKNLEDGNVEIYCEYANPEHLNAFLDSLRNIKTESGLKIENIDIFNEGSDKYGSVDEKIFKGFSVYYGDNLSGYEIDQAERSEFMVFYGMQMFSSMNNGFGKLDNKIDNLGNKIDNLGNDLGNKIDNLGNKIDNLGNDLGNKIDNLGNKIDNLGNDLGNKIDKLGNDLGNKIDNLGNDLGNKIDKLGNDLGNKIDNLGNDLGGKIDLMHSDMNLRFDKLDDKYGAITETMLKLLEQQEEHNRKLDEILQSLTNRSLEKNEVRNKHKSRKGINPITK